MQNIAVEIKENGKRKTLVLTIDLNVKGEPSKSGKSIVVASTRGNATVEGTELKLGLNLYKPA